MVVKYGGTVIGDNTYIGKNVILGYPGKDEIEYLINNEMEKIAGCKINRNCVIRDYGIIYSNARIGKNVKTGHHFLVREYTEIGDDTLIGSGVIIEDKCKIGSNVSIQSSVYIPTNTIIKDNVFIGPRVVFTNDKYMGRGKVKLIGAVVEKNARIGANATILPGINIGEDSVIGAGAVVTRDVEPYSVVVGVPARKIGCVPQEHRR